MTQFTPGDVVRRLNYGQSDFSGPNKVTVNIGDERVVHHAVVGGIYDEDNVYHDNDNLELVRHGQLVDPRGVPQTKRRAILETATTIVHGDREKDYGRPVDSFRRLAAAINIVLEGAGHEPVDPVTAVKLMIALKFSRLAGGDNKDDTWVDLAGYAALGAEVRDEQ